LRGYRAFCRVRIGHCWKLAFHISIIMRNVTGILSHPGRKRDLGYFPTGITW
jgi:hypothetical protein